MEKNLTPFSLISSLLHIPKESTFRRLKYFLIAMLIYATIIGVLDAQFKFFDNNVGLGQFHVLFSFCLAIIISFRINVAHTRWWEARTLWGDLVNNIRGFALKTNQYIGLQKDKELKNYISVLPQLLKFHLRKDCEKCQSLCKEVGIETVKNSNNHELNMLLQAIIAKINNYRLNNTISLEQFLALDTHINAFINIYGGCEKIANTLPPRGFSTFTRFALLFYMLIFPIGWVNSFEWFIIPILLVIIYVLLGLEIIAEEMEEPFGFTSNDLPIDAIAMAIQNNVAEIAGEKECLIEL